MLYTLVVECFKGEFLDGLTLCKLQCLHIHTEEVFNGKAKICTPHFDLPDRRAKGISREIRQGGEKNRIANGVGIDRRGVRREVSKRTI